MDLKQWEKYLRINLADFHISDMVADEIVENFKVTLRAEKEAAFKAGAGAVLKRLHKWYTQGIVPIESELELIESELEKGKL